MLPDTVECMLLGPTAKGSASPFRARDLIQARRQLGEGLDDGSGPPGALLRATWAYFRAGGKRARLVSLGDQPLPPKLSDDSLAQIADGVTRGLRLGPCPLIVLPGIGADARELLRLVELPVEWPDPSPLVLLDAPPTCRSAQSLREAASELLAAGRGRFRLVAPNAVGAAPVRGPSRPGRVSAGALAAGLVEAGGVARIAGSGLSLPSRHTELEERELLADGVIFLTASRGHLRGAGLPRAPSASSSGGEGADAQSPFAPLVEYLQDALAHHTQSVRDRGIYRRVERDATSALGRFFGRGQRGYLVRCNEELNPPEVVAQGLLVVEVILAPPLPVVRQVVLTMTVR